MISAGILKWTGAIWVGILAMLAGSTLLPVCHGDSQSWLPRAVQSCLFTADAPDLSGTVKAPASPESLMPEIPPLGLWPAADTAMDIPPLKFDTWAGPYKNEAGRNCVERVNKWYAEGTAAGLSQDIFRSFDAGHSGLRIAFFPQMKALEPVPSFGQACRNVFPERVTFGVQSYGAEGSSVIERHTREIIRRYYKGELSDVGFQKFFQLFYENNFLFAAPAVGTFSQTEDGFSFLSPFYLHSVGASGTDAQLLKPLVFASAALPPTIKTRALRAGCYVPTLLYLFKNAVAENIRAPDAHLAAYTLPDEAGDGWTGSAPFLDALVTGAHELQHLPPVCCLKLNSVRLGCAEERNYAKRAYVEATRYNVTASLRRGQTLELVLDLSHSWTDGDRPICEYHAAVLRGTATIAPRADDGSLLELRIPWTLSDVTHNYRTDILFLVNDGTYDSAPAYVSVRHIHDLDPMVLGIRAE